MQMQMLFDVLATPYPDLLPYKGMHSHPLIAAFGGKANFTKDRERILKKCDESDGA